MHWIRRHIISTLTLTPNLRYTDLRPKNVAANIFAYHMKALMRDRYIEKVSGGKYALATQGKHYAGYINVDTGLPRKQPKIVVMIIAKNKKGETALFRWFRQPFYGKVSLPYGKTDYGKSPYENAREEIQKKTNLQGRKLNYRGDVYVKTIEGKTILNHMMTHVFFLEHSHGDLKSNVRSGEAFWDKPENIKPADAAPGFKEILTILKQKGSTRFFEEINIKIGK